MIRFSMGAVLGYIILFAVGLALEWSWLKAVPAASLGLFAVLVLTPTAATYVAADLVHRFSPRRLFDHRMKRPAAAAVLGVTSSILGSGAIAALLVFVPPDTPDAVVSGGSGFAAALVIALCLRRVKRGRCIHCDYDLSATAVPRCPECGAMHSG